MTLVDVTAVVMVFPGFFIDGMCMLDSWQFILNGATVSVLDIVCVFIMVGDALLFIFNMISEANDADEDSATLDIAFGSHYDDDEGNTGWGDDAWHFRW